MDEEKFLRGTFILRDLDADELRQFLQITHPVQFSRGTAILREGDEGDTMYFLKEGMVEVSKTMVMRPAGAEHSSRDKILSKISAEDHAIFGEVALFEQNKRTATVFALTDCSLLEIGKADFLRLAEENPRLGYKVTRRVAELLCSRLRKTGEDTIKLTTALSIALSR